jgi:hypothetical protein
MDFDLNEELNDILGQKYPVTALLHEMKHKMGQVRDLYNNDGKSNHFIADIHLYKLVCILAQGHPEADEIGQILELWQTVAKSYRD